MRVTKRLDLDQLTIELTAAGVVFNGLGFDGTDTDGNIYTYINGISAELSAQGQAIVDAHVAEFLPTIGSEQVSFKREKTTTNATATVLWRLPIPTLTMYDVEVYIFGVSRTNASIKKLWRAATFKRINAGPLMLGTLETPRPDKADGTAASWDVSFSFVGNNAVVTVTGANGQTIDWSCFADVRRFKPGG